MAVAPFRRATARRATARILTELCPLSQTPPPPNDFFRSLGRTGSSRVGDGVSVGKARVGLLCRDEIERAAIRCEAAAALHEEWGQPNLAEIYRSTAAKLRSRFSEHGS